MQQLSVHEQRFRKGIVETMHKDNCGSLALCAFGDFSVKKLTKAAFRFGRSCLDNAEFCLGGWGAIWVFDHTKLVVRRNRHTDLTESQSCTALAAKQLIIRRTIGCEQHIIKSRPRRGRHEGNLISRRTSGQSEHAKY
ncbi:MAG: hypothetical protein ACJASV_001935 [Pseudorhodobacter sp.]|jgi:hypothetical protein